MAKKVKEELSIVEMLLDEKNNDNVVLLDPDQNEVEFEQIAIIPIEEKLYAILKPAKEMEGVADDEALVFGVEEIEEQECLVKCEDDKIIDQVFEGYYDLLRAQGINVDHE